MGQTWRLRRSCASAGSYRLGAAVTADEIDEIDCRADRSNQRNNNPEPDLIIVRALPVSSILQDNRRMRPVGRVAYKHATTQQPVSGFRGAVVSARSLERSHNLGREIVGDIVVFDSVFLPCRIRPCQCQHELLASACAPVALAAFDGCAGFQATGENVTGMGGVPESNKERQRPDDGSQDEQPSNSCSKRSKHGPSPAKQQSQYRPV